MKFPGRSLLHRIKAALSPVSSQGGWVPLIRESFAGAWQSGVEIRADLVPAYHAVFACLTLIASDIGKLGVNLIKLDSAGIWLQTTNPAYSPVLRKPNHYQNRIQFFSHWVFSKLLNGNAYVLKVRDSRGIVTRLYLLDPRRVTPLVSSDGGVYYRIQRDDLSGVSDDLDAIPASEIIHDRMNTLFHPLVGLSPIYACGLAATQGLRIQNNSATFFGNQSQPGGVLTAPDEISDSTAARIKAHWETNYSGANAGKVAVLGDGLAYQPIAVTATDAQLIEQLEMTAYVVCSTFHVPPYMIGVGDLPSMNNVEALNQQYYSQCLQVLIESIESCLNEGLGLATDLGVEFDLTGLIRMDTSARYKANSEGIKGGWLSPNEARRNESLPPVAGGDTPYLQQQNYSLSALAKRDALEDPFDTGSPPPAESPSKAEEPDDEEIARVAEAFLTKELLDAHHA